MAVSGIHGELLEVTVISCKKLKDTEWISRQDPYVCLEYETQKFRTRTCTDGGKNPSFQEKYTISLIEGLREISVNVWNSNTLTYDDFIGGGKIQLDKVLLQGYDDSLWPLQTKSGRHAGEVRLIMHYAGAKPSLVREGISLLDQSEYQGLCGHQFRRGTSVQKVSNNSKDGAGRSSPHCGILVDMEKDVMLRALTRSDCVDDHPHKIFLSGRDEMLSLLPRIKKHGKGIVEPQHLDLDIKATKNEDSAALKSIREAVVSHFGVAFALYQENKAWGFVRVDDSLDVVEALEESDYSKFRRESMNGSVGAEVFLQKVEESLEVVIQHVVENPDVVLQSVEGLSGRHQSKGKKVPPVIKKNKQ